MRVHVSLNGFYDWDPVPPDVLVEDKDVKAGRVKAAADGAWLMRVPKKGVVTSTDIHIPEGEILAVQFQDCVKENVVLSRIEAAGHIIARQTAPHHFHRSWITDIQVEDDGPLPDLFNTEIQRFLDAGLIQPEDREELFSRYTEASTNEAAVDHLFTRLGAKKPEVM